MKRASLFVFSLCISVVGYSSNQQGYITADTLKEDEAAQQLIEKVIAVNKAPKPAIAASVNALTRYGFKDLFTQFSYNTLLPYASQVNPNAEAYMQDYLKQHSASLIRMKTWGLPYFNLIDNIFSLYGVPHELKYLAVIESNLSTTATSMVGASGPWQFMPETGRSFGLIINSQTDQRRDYFKSTHAAARYLLQLYRDFNDWLLVIAAYNGGPGRVNDAIRKSGSRNFWVLQNHLPTESKNHVKKFIATHYIMENQSVSTTTSIGHKDSSTIAVQHDLSTEKISGKYVSHILTSYVKMEIELFNRYNPAFDNKLSEEGYYNLVLPDEKMNAFRKFKYQILEASVQYLLSDNQTPAPTPTPKAIKPKKN